MPWHDPRVVTLTITPPLRRGAFALLFLAPPATHDATRRPAAPAMPPWRRRTSAVDDAGLPRNGIPNDANRVDQKSIRKRSARVMANSASSSAAPSRLMRRCSETDFTSSHLA